ncbi:MAG: DUF4168 domain-containing protein [Candidatus Dadabacteria bacterium]|nr:MAG: DUF4168 domain-containing protein [Candidatus Dadabacteria bacterium]
MVRTPICNGRAKFPVSNWDAELARQLQLPSRNDATERMYPMFLQTLKPWTTAAAALAVIGITLPTTHATADEPLQIRARQIVRIDGEAKPVVRKEVVMTDVQFEDLRPDEISLTATAFAAMNRQFELLHRNDFIRYVTAHRRLADLREQYATLRKAIRDPKALEEAREVFRLAAAEALRELGMTFKEYNEIALVIRSDKELTRRFEAVTTSMAWRAQEGRMTN